MIRSILTSSFILVGLCILFIAPASAQTRLESPAPIETTGQSDPGKMTNKPIEEREQKSKGQPSVEAKKAGSSEPASEKKVMYRREIAEYVKTFYIS